jgi:hypothetical protein
MEFFKRAPFAAYAGSLPPLLLRATFLFVSFCGLGAASTPPIPVTCVLELFTSQGCSSCPAADALLTTMARKPDIVAVSFPVDYWDYIGWKDTLADSVFGARQHAYASVHDQEHVYTPQMVIDGLVGVVGSDRGAIESAIAAGKGRDGAVSLPMRFSHAGGVLAVDVPAGDGGPADVVALRVLRSKTVRIGRGENAGRVVTYTNVVRAIDKLGAWTGTMASFTLPELHGDDEGYVVLLQKGALDKPGAILGAVKTAGL